MKILKYSFMLCCMALLAACGNKPKAGYSNVKLDDFFELKLNAAAVIPDSKLKITFTAVPEDSRCPKFTNCVQEGQAKLTLSVSMDGKSQVVEMVRKPSDKGANSVTVGDYKIQLYDLMPYPESGKKINPADYTARMTVRKVSVDK